MLNYLRNKIINKRAKPFFVPKDKKYISNKFSHLNLEYKNYGNKNPTKFFYIIRRTPGAGFFSNLNFVIHNLWICDQLKMIPVIDMVNYKTIYNCRVKINGSLNVWDYYFKPVSKFSLKEVYSSQNVILCDNRTSKKGFYNENSKSEFKSFNGFNFLEKHHRKIFKKYIHIKKNILSDANNFVKNKFKNHKVLGIHFRGSDQKNAGYHFYPPTEKQMLNATNKLLKKFKFSKIYLCTEDDDYLKFYKKHFNKILLFSNSPRTTQKIDLFHERGNRHRYKIGLGNLTDMLILSKTNHLLYAPSNIPEAAIFYSNKKKFPKSYISNGMSGNIFISQFSFNIKKKIPSYLGGFKDKLI